MNTSALTPEAHEQFLGVLDNVAWCKQGEGILVAVHKCVPEILAVMKDHEARVFPGNMNIKINRSTLAEFRTKSEQGEPVPVLLVWKPDVVEIWFRTHKSEEFPYDTWNDPKAAAHERECVTIPVDQLGPRASQLQVRHVSIAKPCPTMIPNL